MIGKRKLFSLLGAVFLLSGSLVGSDEGEKWSYIEESPEQHEQKMQWWNEARFGMFVHWGVYAATGGEFKGEYASWSSEWMMNKLRISIADYKTNNVDRFNPTDFDATLFVRLAKEAGMKYIVITAKHHDGFSMFHSKASLYNVVDATPFGRDVMKELALACADEGIRFGFYYSQCQDWHHPGGMGNNWDDSLEKVSFDEYVKEKAAPEIKQLLTEYGPISIFWWDTPREMSKEAFEALHSSTDLQPGIITNDRLGREYGGDHKTFERRIPYKAPKGVDWEVCMPISASWGYKKIDTEFKSTETLIHNLCDIASKGGNYLLNVSPTDRGILVPEATERLKAMGKWMKVNSESIYGTTASPFERQFDWGRCTKKEYARGTTLYFHVFDWPSDGELLIPGLRSRVGQAYLMDGWQSLKVQADGSNLVVSVPDQAPDEIASVVVVNVIGKLDIEQVLLQPNEEGTLTLPAYEAYLHNNEGSVDLRLREGMHVEIPYLTRWVDKDAWAEWSFRIDRPGTYAVSADLAFQRSRRNGNDEQMDSASEESIGLRVGLPGKLKTATVTLVPGARETVNTSLVVLDIAEAGDYTLQIKPESKGWKPIDLEGVVLKLQ